MSRTEAIEELLAAYHAAYESHDDEKIRQAWALLQVASIESSLENAETTKRLARIMEIQTTPKPDATPASSALGLVLQTIAICGVLGFAFWWGHGDLVERINAVETRATANTTRIEQNLSSLGDSFSAFKDEMFRRTGDIQAQVASIAGKLDSRR